jgi:hypothetical protein
MPLIARLGGRRFPAGSLLAKQGKVVVVTEVIGEVVSVIRD